MTLALLTLILIVIGVPSVISCVLATRLWAKKKSTGAAKLRVALLPLSSFVLLSLLMLIPGYIAAAIVNCNVYPGPDCEHFNDPCLRAFWTSENGDWMDGDRHNCPGHV